MIQSATTVFIHEDGTVLIGTEWIVPREYQTNEVERRELPSMKGVTPRVLPTLDSTNL